MTKHTIKNIVVCGDTAIDWVDFPEAPHIDDPNLLEHCKNWSLEPGTNRVSMGGGAILMTDIIKEVADKSLAKVIGPTKPRTAKSLLDKDKIHSYLHVDNFQTKKDAPPIWRIKEMKGFSRPTECQIGCFTTKEHPVADLLVIDDAANGCRHYDNLSKELNEVYTKNTIVLYKMSRPIQFLRKGKDVSNPEYNCEKCNLWTWVKEKHLNAEPTNGNNLIVVLDAEDLRTEGCDVSKGLSWERTAVDTANVFLRNELNPHERFFKETGGNIELLCWVIVRFGLDGAIIFPPGCDYYTKKELNQYKRLPILVYDRTGIEGKYNATIAGTMMGYGSVLTSLMAAELIKTSNHIKTENIINGVKRGLACARITLKKGYVFREVTTTSDNRISNKELVPQFPICEIANADKQDIYKNFCDVELPGKNSELHHMQGGWSIITAKGLPKIEETATDVLCSGIDSCDDGFPIAKFGKLTTLDKSEIEGYRNIERLVSEYTENTQKKEPLCLAVFGQPGSGKSFGVKQVIKSIIEDIEILTFNISEFTNPKQLARAFHQASDKTGGKRIPLVFFDEFDSKMENQECGWLKHFLAPMNDGEFNDGTDVHPIGRAIFVFAGGTFHSFSDVAEACLDKNMINAKLPDFVSRLRGYLDILGANPAHKTDYTCMLRRATVLNVNLNLRAESLGTRAHWFIDIDRHIRIDDGVSRAFLKAPLYKNSTRSMVAIMEMSSLGSSKGYTKSALPPAHLLDMQVDATAFRNLLTRDAIFLPGREELAYMVHEAYEKREKIKPEKKQSDNAKAWDELDEKTKQSNRHQIDAYLSYLKDRNYFVDLDARQETPVIELTTDDIEYMAEREHERWCNQKIEQGWKHNEERNDELMLHDNIVPWDDIRLSESDKQKDRDAVMDIPKLLKFRRLAIIDGSN